MSCVRCDGVGCGAQGVETPPSGATVSQYLAPGWIAIMTYEGGIKHFCNACELKLRVAAKEIVSVVGRNENFDFSSLLSKKGG